MKIKDFIIYSMVTIFLGGISYAVVSADNKDTKNAKEASKKTYSEEELKKAVQTEVEKTMKKLNGNNMVEFSKELLDKEEAIKVKEMELKKHEDQLKMNATEFEKRVKEFQDTQKKFLACLDEHDSKADKRVDQMVEVISGMRPQNASDLLSVQEAEIAVKILGKLDPAKVSKIFNLMDKEISAKLQKQFMTNKK